VALKRARASRTGSRAGQWTPALTTSFARLSDVFPADFIVRGEHPDGLGNAEVAENEKTFAVGSLLKQAGRFRRKLGMIGQEKPEQHIHVDAYTGRSPEDFRVRTRPILFRFRQSDFQNGLFRGLIL
jgi:hypothetical protein